MSTPVTLKKELFLFIEKHVNIQIEQLLLADPNCYSMLPFTKAHEIKCALERLYLAAFANCSFSEQWTAYNYQECTWEGKLNHADIQNADFSTIDGMLTARFSIKNDVKSGCSLRFWETEPHFEKKLSLKEALNISRDNIFGGRFGFYALCGPLFGQTSTLNDFENSLIAENSEQSIKLN